MATVYSAEQAIGSYNRIRIKCDYSGSSATLTIQFRRTSGYNTTWRDTSARLIFNGQDKAADYDYTGYVGTDWVTLRPAISGYTISTSGGTYNWQFTNPLGGVLGCSGTITIPSQASKPSDGYINDLSSYWDDTLGEVNVHTGSAGVLNEGGASLTGLQWNITTAPYTSGIARLNRSISNGGASTLSTSKSSWTGTAITLVPNSEFYTGIYAANSAGEYRYNGGTFITCPAPFQVTVANITKNSATVYYATTNDGGYYGKSFEYSIDGGTTWNVIEIVSGSTVVEHNYQITGLQKATEYTLKTRVVTQAATTNCSDVVFKTLDNIPNLYGSASSAATHINKFLGGQSGTAKRIYKIYGSKNNKATPIFVRHVHEG